MVAERRASARIKIEKAAEKAPETPNPIERPKKVMKVPAKRKASDIESPASKRVAIGTPRIIDSSSAQASPAPFNKLSKDLPLPTAPVDAQFVETNLQSIAKSGVLATSVARSRSQWTSGAIFERYWTKPRRSKKEVIEPDKNPSKETMTTVLGKVRVTIEPHTIDAAIYGIRDPPLPASTLMGPAKPPNPVGRPPAIKPGTPAPAYIPGQTRPMQASPIGTSGQQAFNAPKPPAYQPQMSPGTNQAMSPYPAPPHVNPQPSALQPANVSTPGTAATNAQTPAATQPAIQGQATPNPQQASNIAASQPGATQNQPPPNQVRSQPQASPQSAPLNRAQGQTQQGQQQPPRPQQANQDPVIQALARRAQENPTLKGLMKVVAGGSANKEQLAEFQRHIDELSRMIRAQQNNGNIVNQPPKPAAVPSPATTGPQNLQQYPQATSTTPTPRPTMPLSNQGLQRAPLGTPTPYQYQPIARPQPQPRPPPPPETYKGLAIEFVNPTAACNSTPNDRLLFPKQCFVSRSPDWRILTLSFLVVKNQTSTGKAFNVPVTMTLEQIEGKFGLLGVIERTIAPLAETQNHMAEVLRTTERAPDLDLVLRVPGSGDERRTSQAVPATAARGSPGAGEGITLRRGKKKEEDLRGLCSYCYSPVGEVGERDNDGNVSCRACAALKMKAQMGRMGLAVRVKEVGREVRAAECLVWS